MEVFCEERLCGWIVEPSNTVSNISYLVVGLILIRLMKKEKREDLCILPVSALAVFVGSTLFHMSATWPGEVLDLIGMYLFSSFLISRNAARLGFRLKKEYTYWGLVILSVIVLLKWPPIGINLFTVHATVFVLLELWIIIRDGQQKYHRWIFSLYGVFIASLILWGLDIKGIACEPQNHWLQLHSFWHLLNSLTFYYAYKFYKEIK